MSERERPMPETNPLMFFGNWCGPGWSAGRKAKNLTPADMKVRGKPMTDPSGASRDSPVDLVCKAHDIRYEAAYLTKDQLKRAQMIQAADLRLLSDMIKLHADIKAGRLELNKEEVWFSAKMFVVFNNKLIVNGRTIATLRTERAVGLDATNALRLMYRPTMMVLGLPSLRKPNGAPQHAQPAHPPKPVVVRFDRDEAWMRVMANPNPMWGR